MYLWYGSIVPDVSVVWETVVYKSYSTFLNVLLDWVQFLFQVDLETKNEFKNKSLNSYSPLLL